MTTLAGNLTLADYAGRVDDSGRTRMIVEMLSMTNEIFEDMMVVEANAGTKHKTTVRTGLPSATWRLLNYGVVKSKSTTANVQDTLGNLEATSEIDVGLVELAADQAEFRLTESIPFFESMSQTMATTIFYGNEMINPERFTGLAPRYSVLSGTAPIGNNVLSAAGDESDNTSIWIITWGPNATHGIIPRGGRVGISHQDKGQERVTDGSGNPFYAYVDWYKWQLGLSVRDWRYNVRIANIDVSDLATGSAANLVHLLIRGAYLLPTTNGVLSPVTSSDAPSIRGAMGRTVIYCNRTIRAYIDLQALNKANLLLQYSEVNGRTFTQFRGVPIRTCDAILNTESQVV
jgi:hypothetical protein